MNITKIKNAKNWFIKISQEFIFIYLILSKNTLQPQNDFSDENETPSFKIQLNFKMFQEKQNK